MLLIQINSSSTISNHKLSCTVNLVWSTQLKTSITCITIWISLNRWCPNHLNLNNKFPSKTWVLVVRVILRDYYRCLSQFSLDKVGCNCINLFHIVVHLLKVFLLQLLHLSTIWTLILFISKLITLQCPSNNNNSYNNNNNSCSNSNKIFNKCSLNSSNSSNNNSKWLSKMSSRIKRNWIWS